MKRIPKNRLNQAYWDARDSITDDWIKEQIENDKDFADKQIGRASCRERV